MVMEDHLGEVTLDRDMAEEGENTCVPLGGHSEGVTPGVTF